MGSGIIGVGSGIRRVGSGIVTQGSGCTIFVRSGTKTGHAFGIKNQKFAYKNGISDGKTYLVTTLLILCVCFAEDQEPPYMFQSMASCLLLIPLLHMAGNHHHKSLPGLGTWLLNTNLVKVDRSWRCFTLSWCHCGVVRGVFLSFDFSVATRRW